MLSLLEAGPLGIDAYLRVLVSIDEEVVARQIPHTDIVSLLINFLYVVYKRCVKEKCTLFPCGMAHLLNLLFNNQTLFYKPCNISL